MIRPARFKRLPLNKVIPRIKTRAFILRRLKRLLKNASKQAKISPTICLAHMSDNVQS